MRRIAAALVILTLAITMPLLATATTASAAELTPQQKAWVVTKRFADKYPERARQQLRQGMDEVAGMYDDILTDDQLAYMYRCIEDNFMDILKMPEDWLVDLGKLVSIVDASDEIGRDCGQYLYDKDIIDLGIDPESPASTRGGKAY